jgi:ribose/xylose/arabinose/galactoside ABC-type transport system permease subunit
MDETSFSANRIPLRHTHATFPRTPRTLRVTLVLIVLWAGLALYPETRGAFLTPGNLSNITAQIAELVIISVGMTFVVLTGGIDLSVGAGMALFGVIAATLQIDHHCSAPIAITAVLVASVATGLWHGFLVGKLGVPPLIATLSSLLAYRGLALVISKARGLSPMNSDFAFLGGRIPAAPATAICIASLVIGLSVLVLSLRRRRSFGLPPMSPWVVWGRVLAIVLVFAASLWIYQRNMPVPVLVAGIVTALGTLLLTSSRLGRYAHAVGGNPAAAHYSGIPVLKVKVAVYLIASVLTAVAALIATSRTNGVTPGNMGMVRELHAITAVIVGGTSLSGGRATMLGTLLGALVFGTLSNGMNLLNLSSHWQLVITGVTILGAAALEAWSTRTENLAAQPGHVPR